MQRGDHVFQGHILRTEAMRRDGCVGRGWQSASPAGTCCMLTRLYSELCLVSTGVQDTCL